MKQPYDKLLQHHKCENENNGVKNDNNPLNKTTKFVMLYNIYYLLNC